MNSKIETSNAQLTPDYLDTIINNPNEHPQIKKQAEQLKKNLFPTTAANIKVPTKIAKPPKKALKELTEADFISEEPIKVEDVSVEEEKNEDMIEEPNIPIVIPQATKEEKPKVVKPIAKSMEIKMADPKEFDSFISDFKNNLFNDEFILPSSPDTKIQLRSMTVAEYKFLSKQFEVYQRSLESINRDNPEASRETDIRESILTNAIDNVLQRCITNDIRVFDLTLFDWVYIILAVRAISRGTEENLRVHCNNPKCGKDIKLGVLTLLKKIEENKDKFIVNPVGMVQVKEGFGLYLGLPTRSDLIQGQRIFLADPDMSLGFINIAMYIKAYINEQNIANLLNPDQRVALMDVLPYDVIKQVKTLVNANFKAFYDCLGEIKCAECGRSIEIDVSDFILFFYDF